MRHRLVLSVAVVVAIGVHGTSGRVAAAVPSKVAGQLEEVLAEFNRGAALMEQYRYVDAAKAFEAVVKTSPGWTAARFNLGLAYFNMHGARGAKQNLATARDTFLKVLEFHPKHLHAMFCLGLYYEHVGESEKALQYFHAVYRDDGDDPFVAYKYAVVLISLGRNEEGTAILEKVVALDPGFISGIYRLAMQYNRLRQRDKAVKLLGRFQQLKRTELTGGSFTVGKAYGTVGKYYMVLGADNRPLRTIPPEPGPRILFSPKTKLFGVATAAWKWKNGSVDLPGIAATDVDADGDLDLCLTVTGKTGDASIWLNDGKGRFRVAATLANRGVSPCFGDVDNDGDPDLWLGRAGADFFFENNGKGNFRNADLAALAGPHLLTATARLADVDSDGDLDLLAFRAAKGDVPAGERAAAPGSIFNNNRDGSYTDIAQSLGLALPKTPAAAVVYDDFDNDKDLDLIVFPVGRAPVAWVNDRGGKFHLLAAEATGLASTDAVGAITGDPDKDGDRDLLVFSGDAVRLYVNRGQFRFKADAGFDARSGPLGGTGGQFADMDNDGDLDLVIADAHRPGGRRGPALLINDLPRNRFLDAEKVDPGNLFAAIRFPGNAGCVAADFTGNGNCDVLLVPTGEKPVLIENVTSGGHWIALDLRGTRAKDKKTRSNNSAIGARVEIKTGNVFQQYVVGVGCGPTAMPPLRIHAGLGHHTKVDWLRIIWPDAVLQAELELPGDRIATVTELSRKTSSCPYLFAWDGSRFRFVADFGGVGGLGYLVEPGVYAKPDPTEYLRLPPMKPKQGEYVLQAVTPLEEVTYFDEAKLIAVDHPAGTEVYPNEMMAINAPPPRFEVFCYSRAIEPVRALDHRGKDVTEQIRGVDRRYAGPTELDHRFIGLAEPHFVELDFGDRLKELSPDARLVLFLQGWVEYGYSSTNYAAAQAGLRTEAPSIHVLRDGRWVELFHEVGYPAGVQHTMTLEVTGKILPSDRRIRIGGNMELYWDRIFLACHLDDAKLALTEVAPGEADLHFRGYPREYSPDGHHPNLADYANLDRAVSWKLMSGHYTRYGGVEELLDKADDRFVIMGRGEEITLRFPAEKFGPVPAGYKRTLLLKTDSFCKDMDLYTAHPDTVEPLPFHGMSGYPYGQRETYPDTEATRQYRRRYNTRQVRAE